MTQTLALVTPSAAGRYDRLAALADRFQMTITADADRIDPWVKEGLLGFRDREAPGTSIFLIGAREESTGAWTDSFLIHQELIDSRSKDVEPRLLKFLAELPGVIENDDSPTYLVATDEWTQGDEAVFFGGSAQDAVSFLKMNKSFNLYFLREDVPGVREGTPRYPFVFEIFSEDL